MGNHFIPTNFKEDYYTHNGITFITGQEAWTLLQQDERAQLVDVRTQHEWETTGIFDLSMFQKIPLCISWRLLPDMRPNPSFCEEVSHKINDKTTRLLFVCRSGVRSYEAAQAMKQQGYVNCYNIDRGVEGIMNTHIQTENSGQHSVRWKVATCPWEQK